MCAAPLSETPERWNGPVSRALLAFNSMVTEVSNNLRNLVEMVVLAMCAHGDTDRLILDPKSWTQLGLKYCLFVVLMLMIGFRSCGSLIPLSPSLQDVKSSK